MEFFYKNGFNNAKDPQKELKDVREQVEELQDKWLEYIIKHNPDARNDMENGRKNPEIMDEM